MPAYLPPVSRRRFISSTLGATAALLLGRPFITAAEKPVDPHAWILFSDTHVVADRAFLHPKTKINMADNLARAVTESLALPNRATGVLVCGDCAYNKGEPGDYTTFTQLLQPLREAGLPIHVTLGNHDHRENLWNAIAETKATKHLLPDRHVAMIPSERANWFVLDSMEQVNVTPGLLGEGQLEWLRKSLDENAGKPAIVMVHHNPVKGETKSALKDTDKLLEIMTPRKHVKALFFGHTHHWENKEENGIHLVNLPPTAYPFNNTDPNGWVLANLEKDGIKLKLHAFDTTHEANGQVVDLKWRT